MNARNILASSVIAIGAALLIVVWPRPPSPGAFPAPASAPASNQEIRLAPAPLSLATRFAARMAQWETARYPEADKIEEELKALIDDDNASALLEALPERFQSTYLGNELLARWAKRDRLAALRWLGGRSEPTPAQILTAVRDWGAAGDTALLRYVDTLPASAWKERLTVGVVQDTLQNQDPELAFAISALLSPGEMQLRLLRDAAMKWSMWDPRSALAEIERLPDRGLQEKLIPSVAAGYATFAPREAANWLIASLPSGEALNGGVACVVQAWASQPNPAEAEKWIAQLPAGPLQERATEALLAVWREQSSPRAQAWVDGLSDSGLRARASAQLTRSD